MMNQTMMLLFVASFCLPSLAQESESDSAVSASSQEKQIVDDDQRKNYVSEASCIVALYKPKVSDHSAKEMAGAAIAFIETLKTEQKAKAVHELRSPERREWTNLPAPRDAGGIRMGDLGEKQIVAACDLMAALLSDKGYAKIRDIMLADDQLLREGKPRPGFGTENFSIVLFGTPSATEPWAFQLDGHHIGLNVSISGENYSMSPSFIGTQPEAFKIGETSFRPMASESDLAYKLIGSLSVEQQREAITSPLRSSIRSGPGMDGFPPDARGISCENFNEAQKKLILELVSNWLDLHPPAFAEARKNQVASEIDKMHLAWNGPITNRGDVSYAIQGPSLVIEFACQQMGGNPLNHLHTMYRDPTNEYANQLEK